MSIESVSVTEQIDFQSCRRYWYWSNYADGAGYQSKAPQSYMWLGSLLHSGIEAYYKTDRNIDEALKAYDDRYKRFVAEAREEYAWVWERMQDDLIRMYEIGRGMLINYDQFEKSGQSCLRGEVAYLEDKPLVEHKIKLPVINPETGEPTNIFLVGKLDLILVDGDEFWIVDHKSSGSSPAAGGIDVDDQLTAYMYMFWREFGILPTGAIYNVLIRSLPEPPIILKSGGFSRAKNQNTVYEVYRATLERAGEDLSKYADILDYFQKEGWSGYFIQQEAIRNESELRAYEQRLYYRLQDMINAYNHPDRYAYPQPSARGCGNCPFLSPCKAKDDGGDYMILLETLFTRREMNHATVLSTDSQTGSNP